MMSCSCWSTAANKIFHMHDVSGHAGGAAASKICDLQEAILMLEYIQM
jgi:hypothetical protein